MSRCWHIFENHFSTNKSEIHQEIESENLCQQKYEERLKEEDFGDSKYGLLRKYLWNLTEYPETSLAAQVIGKQKWKDFCRKKWVSSFVKVYAFLSLAVVILSTVTFVLGTMPQLAPDMDIILFEENGTEIKNVVERWEEVRGSFFFTVTLKLLKGVLALKIMDEFVMWFFTIGISVKMKILTDRNCSRICRKIRLFSAQNQICHSSIKCSGFTRYSALFHLFHCRWTRGIWTHFTFLLNTTIIRIVVFRKEITFPFWINLTPVSDNRTPCWWGERGKFWD